MDHLLFRAFRKILRKNPNTNRFVDFVGQQANDYISKCFDDNSEAFMISKFGTIELDNIICYEVNKRGINLFDYRNALSGRYSIHMSDAFDKLCNNAGFFPKDIRLLDKYNQLVRQDIKEINILGSYLNAEEFINDDLSSSCVKVDLDGYYAPFLWENPWTKYLKGKKVLVVHPFVESIKSQYERRELLFDNPDVLPEFSALYLIKAVQSIAGNGSNTGFKDWFEALDYMKNEMDKYDYDVALIGCGAYGMDLAAHAKRSDKIAVHMAGWTQMLFGIYGKRWLEDQPQYSKFINKYWIRPNENERPSGIEKVEGGCYW